jgi:hypothetical protein
VLKIELRDRLYGVTAGADFMLGVVVGHGFNLTPWRWGCEASVGACGLSQRGKGQPFGPPSIEVNAPGKTRTCDLLIRSQTLYPTELRVRFLFEEKLRI